MAKNRRKFTKCPNCAYTFNDANNYCPNCGQENHDLNVPVKHLIWEFLEGTMHYDTKALRTVKYLLFRPGKLTQELNIGRRASYVPPFRLYVFVSLLFFTVAAFRSSDNLMVVEDFNAQGPVSAVDSTAAERLARADSATTALAKSIGAKVLPDDQLQNTGMVQEIQEKFKRFTRNQEQSRQKLLKNTSFMMFALMPFFGFVLYLFYRRKGRNYVEHLIFSIHFHTFFFVLSLLLFPLELIINGFDTEFWLFWISLIYLYLALHYVYKDSYLRTFFKFIPLSLIYLFSLFALFMCTLAVSIALS